MSLVAKRRRMLARRLRHARRLVTTGRTERADRRLAQTLAFVAGAINAGGFVAAGQYTSHMSGIISSLADNAITGAWLLVAAGAGALLAFTAGAGVSAFLINWSRRQRNGAPYASPLLVEAVLLAALGFAGAIHAGSPGFIASVIPLLCFIMGLQNATITKVSGARMRTTHMTGIVTDIGIELGKLAYWNRHGDLGGRVLADRTKLRLLGSLLGAFVLGGVFGALGFDQFGFAATLPLALVLTLLGMAPVIEAALLGRARSV